MCGYKICPADGRLEIHLQDKNRLCDFILVVLGLDLLDGDCTKFLTVISSWSFNQQINLIDLI